MKIKELEKTIKSIEKKRADCIIKLMNIKAMVRGSFHETFTKCGRKGCDCETGSGHPCQRITWREKSKASTKGVPDDQKKWAKEMTENYKKFRKYRHEVKKLEVIINQILNEFEAQTVEDSWGKNKNFKI